MRLVKSATVALCCGLALFGCDDDDDNTSTDAGGGEAGSGGGEAGSGGGEAGSGGSVNIDPSVDGWEACDPLATDYPDGWAACISDDGRWHLAGTDTPSSAARVAAFEDIGAKLWLTDGPADSDAFGDASLIYGEDEGVGSRVSRRYDSHVDKPTDADCKADNAATEWPDYCVGPASIAPLITQAFTDGIAGTEPLLNEARVEAGLIWFYYISTYKEANTCADKAKDCDSSWAYYTGAKQLSEAPLGFAGYVDEVSSALHADVFDALLGLRCWRYLDSAETAEDTAMHEQALAQLDRALDRGMGAVLRDRLVTLTGATGDERAAHQEFLKILGPVFDRGARALDTTTADQLATLWAGDIDDAAASELVTLLDDLFVCE